MAVKTETNTHLAVIPQSLVVRQRQSATLSTSASEVLFLYTVHLDFYVGMINQQVYQGCSVMQLYISLHLLITKYTKHNAILFNSVLQIL